MPQDALKVDKWTIRPDINRIESPQGTQNVGPRVMQLLLILLKAPGEVHSREKLITEVWQEVIVNEESLTKGISFLRQYFKQGDTEYIETIRSVGYRWIGPEPAMIESPRPIEKAKTHHQPVNLKPVLWVTGILILSSLLFSYINRKTEDKEPDSVSLTKTKIQERVPRLSPDGRLVLFAQATPNEGSMDIYTKEIETGEVTRLTSSQSLETDPAWSPDGSKVAYYKNNSEDVVIMELDLKTLKKRKLVNAHAIPNLSAISWAPNGQSLTYSDQDYQTKKWCIYSVNLNNLEVEKLTLPGSAFYGDVSPRFSPDGKKLAFIRIRERGLLYKHLIPGIGDVFVLDLESRQLEKIHSDDMEVSGVEWVDNQQLGLIRVEGHFNFEVSIFNLKDDETNTLYHTRKLLRNLSKAREHPEFVFEEWTERYSIWKADFSNENSLGWYRPFIDLADKSWHPQINHNGTELVYISTNSGRSEIWLHHIKAKSDTQLTHLSEALVRNPRWSPDDKHLLYESYDDDDFDLYILDLEKGEHSAILTSDKHYERNATWSKDGESIFYSKKDKGSYTIYNYHLKTGQEEKIADQAFILRENEFGRFYLSFEKQGIFQVSPYGHHSLIIDDVSLIEWFNWELVDNWIYYVKRGKDFRPILCRYDLNTGEKVDLTEHQLNFSYVYQGFTVDHKNKVVYATVNDFRQSDIRMISTKGNPALALNNGLEMHLKFISLASPLLVP